MFGGEDNKTYKTVDDTVMVELSKLFESEEKKKEYLNRIKNDIKKNLLASNQHDYDNLSNLSFARQSSLGS